MNKYYRAIKAISQVAAINDVIEHNVETGTITNLNNNKDITFVNPENQTFFMPISEFVLDQSHFNIGDLVSYRYGKVTKGTYEITKIDRNVKCTNEGIKVTYKYAIKEINNGQEYRDVSACYMAPVQHYYFINSNCQIHQAIVTNSEADIYRKLTKNWYKTKEEAESVLDALFHKNFQCSRAYFHYNFDTMDGAKILSNIKW